VLINRRSQGTLYQAFLVVLCFKTVSQTKYCCSL